MGLRASSGIRKSHSRKPLAHLQLHNHWEELRHREFHSRREELLILPPPSHSERKCRCLEPGFQLLLPRRFLTQPPLHPANPHQVLHYYLPHRALPPLTPLAALGCSKQQTSPRDSPPCPLPQSLAYRGRPFFPQRRPPGFCDRHSSALQWSGALDCRAQSPSRASPASLGVEHRHPRGGNPRGNSSRHINHLLASSRTMPSTTSRASLAAPAATTKRAIPRV